MKEEALPTSSSPFSLIYISSLNKLPNASFQLNLILFPPSSTSNPGKPVSFTI